MTEQYDLGYTAKLEAKRTLYKKYDRDAIYVNCLAQRVEHGANLLDLATGVSEIPLKLAQLGYKVFGIDINESNNALSRDFSHPDIEFREGDILHTPYQIKFKGVLAKDIVEHLSEDEIEEFKKEVLRLLSQDGVLVVGCPVKTASSRIIRAYNLFTKNNFTGIDDTGDTSHLHWFRTKELVSIFLRGNKFTLKETRYMLYGINNYPRSLISPMHRLQKFLGTNFPLLQRILGVRVILIFKNNSAS
jgi:2-polyprenyl-3-methyl-5-hydroxy-6-metoxy-1,4-benzoquinol methylase